MYDLGTIQRMNREQISPSSQMPEDRRTITIDVETGEWMNTIQLTSEESARVAASVLLGMHGLGSSL